jgi:serine/threonine protein kinase
LNGRIEIGPLTHRLQVFARKLIRPFATIMTEDVQNEIRAVTKLCSQKHPNVIDVLCHDWLKGSPYYAIDMEFCELTLADYIRGDRELIFKTVTTEMVYSERIVKWLEISVIMKDIINGISFIHNCNEVHRDLKPSNSIFPPAIVLRLQFSIQLVQGYGK